MSFFTEDLLDERELELRDEDSDEWELRELRLELLELTEEDQEDMLLAELIMLLEESDELLMELLDTLCAKDVAGSAAIRNADKGTIKRFIGFMGKKEGWTNSIVDDACL